MARLSLARQAVCLIAAINLSQSIYTNTYLQIKCIANIIYYDSNLPEGRVRSHRRDSPFFRSNTRYTMRVIISNKFIEAKGWLHHSIYTPENLHCVTSYGAFCAAATAAANSTSLTAVFAMIPFTCSASTFHTSMTLCGNESRPLNSSGRTSRSKSNSE